MNSSQIAENGTGGRHVGNNQATTIVFRRFEPTVFRVLLSKEKKMKKLASILSISAISMAVALAPAFAQQTKPMEPAGTATVQPKSDVNVPANQTGKDEKNLPAKPGSELKPGAGAKTTASSTSGKPMGDVKTNVKPGANLKSAHTAKSSVHSKAVATSRHHVKKSSRKPASRMHAKASAI